MMTGLENVLRSMFAAVEVSPEWFRIVSGQIREKMSYVMRRQAEMKQVTSYFVYTNFLEALEAKMYLNL